MPEFLSDILSGSAPEPSPIPTAPLPGEDDIESGQPENTFLTDMVTDEAIDATPIGQPEELGSLHFPSLLPPEQALSAPSPRTMLIAEAVRTKDYQMISHLGISPDSFRQLIQEPSLIDQYARLPLEVGGALGGEAIGAATGTVLAPGPGTVSGAIAGGLLGAAAGHGLANFAERIENGMRGFVQIDERSGLTIMSEAAQKQLADMMSVGTTDAQFNMGFRSLAGSLPWLAKLGGNLIGLADPAVRRAVAEARAVGINLSSVELDTPATKILNKLLFVLPIIGKSARIQGQTQVLRGQKALEQETLKLVTGGPILDFPRMGGRLAVKGAKTNKARYMHAERLYQALTDNMIKAGDPTIFPTRVFKDMIEDILGKKMAVPSATADPVQSLKTAGLGDNLKKRMESWLNMEEFVSASNYRELLRDVNGAFQVKKDAKGAQTVSRDDFDALRDIRTAVHRSMDEAYETAKELGQVGTEGRISTEIIDQLRGANKAWTEFKMLEDTYLATNVVIPYDNKFFQRGLSKKGLQLEPRKLDQMATRVLDNPGVYNSPNYVDEITELYGEGGRKLLFRSVLEQMAQRTKKYVGVTEEGPIIVDLPVDQGSGEAFKNFMNKRAVLRASEGTTPSTITEGGKIVSTIEPIAIMDATTMRKALGFENVDDAARQMKRSTLKKWIEGTGIDPQKLDTLLKVVSRIEKSPAGDPSTFLQRRLIFSGVSMLTAGAAGGLIGIPSSVFGNDTSFGTKLIILGGIVMTGKAFSKLMSSPRGLQVMMDGMDPRMNDLKAARLVERIHRTLSSPENNSTGDQPAERVDPNVFVRMFDSGAKFIKHLEDAGNAAGNIANEVTGTQAIPDTQPAEKAQRIQVMKQLDAQFEAGGGAPPTPRPGPLTQQLKQAPAPKFNEKAEREFDRTYLRQFNR